MGGTVRDQPRAMPMAGTADRRSLRRASAHALAANLNAVRHFVRVAGRLPRLSPPFGFLDKFFWRKAYDHDPLFAVLCDKLAAKDFVRARCPEVAVPDVLWSGRDARDMPDALWRDGVILKAAGGCGYNVRITAADIDQDAVARRFARWMRRPYGRQQSEWAYSQVPPRMFAEAMVAGSDVAAPVTLGVICIDGRPHRMTAVTGFKGEARHCALFDAKGRRLDFDDPIIPIQARDWRLPDCFEQAVAAAAKITADMDQMRCDFLLSDGRVWFNEFTIYTCAGLPIYTSPDGGDDFYGTWDIRGSWFVRTPQTGWREAYRHALAAALEEAA